MGLRKLCGCVRLARKDSANSSTEHFPSEGEPPGPEHGASTKSTSTKGSTTSAPQSARKVSWSWNFSRTKKVTRSSSRTLFEDAVRAPAIGGCVDLTLPHSDFLLPQEVVLFEPSNEELFREGKAEGATRQIFLNTPLSAFEISKLGELHQALRDDPLVSREGDENFPEYVNLHALRLLQQKKFNVQRTMDLILVHLSERVSRLPLAEKDVLPDLRSGFMYWHGRDRKCRPCLVIRMENMGEMNKNKERAVRLVIFVLEYALRFAMVPGRVENWVVILDLKNTSSVVSIYNLTALAATAKMIATTLESVYCGRMVWMKIVNMNNVLRRIVESCIPTEKKKKVHFVQNVREELAPEFEGNQLEVRYGGGAPDLNPSEVYPFRFFPGASSASGSEQRSVHHHTNRPFHEGKLWDTSTPAAARQWVDSMRSASLTPAAATALSDLGAPVKPCQDMVHWLQLLSEAARAHEPDQALADQVAANGPEVQLTADAGNEVDDEDLDLVTL